MNVELRQIRHAVAVARHGSFARAAAELQLSQSGLSRSVQALELQMGTPIFVRSAHGVLTTDVGRLFLERSQALLAMADRFDAQVLRNRSLQRGRLVIAAGPLAIESCVAEACARFAGQFPLVTVEIRSAAVADMPQPLRVPDLDVLVTEKHLFEGAADVRIEALAPHPLVLFGRKGHPLTGRAGLALADIFEHPLVVAGKIGPAPLEVLMEAQRQCPSPLGRQRAFPAVQAASAAVARRIVAASDALMSMPAALAQPDVAAGLLMPLMPLEGMAAHFAIVQPVSRLSTATAELFCHHVRAADAEHADAGRQLLRSWFG